MDCDSLRGRDKVIAVGSDRLNRLTDDCTPFWISDYVESSVFKAAHDLAPKVTPQIIVELDGSIG